MIYNLWIPWKWVFLYQLQNDYLLKKDCVPRGRYICLCPVPFACIFTTGSENRRVSNISQFIFCSSIFILLPRSVKIQFQIHRTHINSQSSCLHRASLIIEHFIVQLMHNIQYVGTIKIIKYLKVLQMFRIHHHKPCAVLGHKLQE